MCIYIHTHTHIYIYIYVNIRLVQKHQQVLDEWISWNPSTIKNLSNIFAPVFNFAEVTHPETIEGLQNDLGSSRVRRGQCHLLDVLYPANTSCHQQNYIHQQIGINEKKLGTPAAYYWGHRWTLSDYIAGGASFAGMSTLECLAVSVEYMTSLISTLPLALSWKVITRSVAPKFFRVPAWPRWWSSMVFLCPSSSTFKPFQSA